MKRGLERAIASSINRGSQARGRRRRQRTTRSPILGARRTCSENTAAENIKSMVQTGSRAALLLANLVESGLRPAPPPERPSLADLPNDTAAEVLRVYRQLGGLQEAPTLRPGGWDLSLSGPLVVELDEELHFNRYRAATLSASWATVLPWTADYRRYCVEYEGECLSAGSWGKRWTNDSAGRMFSGGTPRDLGGDGSPRWKQRALYDALKDTAPSLPGGVRLARVSTHDTVEGISLGAVLEGLATVDPGSIRALISTRTAQDPLAGGGLAPAAT